MTKTLQTELLVVGGGACLWAYRVLGGQDRGTKA